MENQFRHFVFKLIFFVTRFLLFYCFIGYNTPAISSLTYKTPDRHNTQVLTYEQLKFNANSKTKKNNHKKTDGKIKSLNSVSQTETNKEIWSNAFNFKKSWGTQVDPRTGILSAFIKAGSMVSNLGHGPDISLQVNYSSISTANPDNIAMGWSWNLTHFNPVTNQLITSAGQNFHLVQNRDGLWQPLYHKLRDILIQGDKTHGFTITYANGLQETLNSDGYETRLEQQNGWGVNFIYSASRHMLNSIEDDHNHRINIAFSEGYITVTSYNVLGKPVNIRINNSNARLSDVLLPLKSSTGIHINYDDNRISETDYPTGLKKYFYYNCSSAIKVPGINRTSGGILCAVSQENTRINGQKKDDIIHYEYMQANANMHDYLGFNSGLIPAHGSVTDFLFDAPVDYTYRTTEGNGIVKEVRTYNKYHLLIDDKKIDDRTEHVLSEIQNFYCRTDKLNGCAQTSFKDLPATYSLPLQTVTKLWGNSAGKAEVSTVERTYNEQGQVTSLLDNYGRLTKRTYCSAKGDTYCPAEPEEWSLIRLPETITVYPASRETSASPLPPAKIYNYYHKEFNHTGHGYMLVLDHKVQQSGDQKRIVIHSYYNDPENDLTYGLIEKTTMTGNVQGALTSINKGYRYIENTDEHSRTIYTSIEIDKNKSRPLPAVTTSLFTNQILQKIDATGKNITHYHYDLWGRIIQTDLNEGTAFARHIRYQYTLLPWLNQVLITEANGLQHKVIMDSAGRQVMRFDETVTANGNIKFGQWLLKNKTTYDSHGRVIEKYRYLIDSSGKVHTLVNVYHYNAMGDADKIQLSDGETVIRSYNDSLHCTVSYRQDYHGMRSPLSVVIANTLGEPVTHITLPATQTLLPSTAVLCENGSNMPGAIVSTMTYDGFGRVITMTDPMGITTYKTYDALGQMTDVTDAVGNKIHHVYNLIGKVIQTWFFPYSGGQYLLSSSCYNAAGDLLWHAGEDGKHTAYTYTADGKLKTTTTPAGHVIRLQYNSPGLPVAKYIDGKLQLQTDYDTVTLLPVKQTDSTGVTVWTYTDDHLPWQTVHTGNNGYPDYQFKWEYDQNRRVISTTDIHGDKTSIRYDSLGRASSLYYKDKILSASSYDGLSRIVAVHYGSGMERTIHYDSYGRQQKVDDTLNHQQLSQWNYTYDTDNNIIQISQTTENNKSAVINYRYDKQDNLVSMSCDGSSGLPLCPRDTSFAGSGLKSAPIITRQDYFFTPLNRIAQVKEVLQNGENKQTLSKVITYDYSDTKKPLRLQSINTSWNKKTNITERFSYDTVGNMTEDGEGNHITYNMFNQVTSVTKPDGKQSFYCYNGNGQEVKERSSGNTYYLFYRDNVLVNEIINSAEQSAHTVGYYGIARTTEGVIDQYYECNYKHDITGVLSHNPQNKSQYQLIYYNIYSPYGMTWHQSASASQLHLADDQKPFYGFDGERTDPATHWQFLGAGHRSYNPGQRYFVSEDAAGDGYRFGNNNPIMNTDPTGDTSKWLETTARIVDDISTFGLASLHKKWANITASVVLAGLTVVSVAAAVSTYGCTAIAVAASTTALLSSVPVAAAAVPANKGLNIAGAVSGVLTLAVAVATTAPLMGSLTAMTTAFFGGDELVTDLGRSLRSLNLGLRISRFGFTDYLTINDDEQLMAARNALRRAAFITDDLDAALIATRVSGRSINLKNIQKYMDIFNQFTREIDGEQSYRTIAELPGMTEARKVLFSQFGKYTLKRMSMGDILFKKSNYRNYFIKTIVRLNGNTSVVTGFLGDGISVNRWFFWGFNDNGALITSPIKSGLDANTSASVLF